MGTVTKSLLLESGDDFFKLAYLVPKVHCHKVAVFNMFDQLATSTECPDGICSSNEEADRYIAYLCETTSTHPADFYYKDVVYTPATITYES